MRWPGQSDDEPKVVYVDVLPRYCAKSGETLEVIREDLGYDEQTGKKRYRYWLSCPSAERKDTPYVPHYGSYSRARLVNCEATAWAERPREFDYTTFAGYVDCTPWPKPIRIEQPAAPRRRKATGA